MTNIPFAPLKKIIQDEESKIRPAKDSKIAMGWFDIVIDNLIEEAHKLTEEEFAMLIMSIQKWVKDRNFTKTKHKVKVGEIYFVDLGMLHKPELAYQHSVLVLQLLRDYAFVVPITSSADRVANAFHPIKNPSGNTRMRRVYDCDGFEKTSVLLLENARTISYGRLIDKKGDIDSLSLLLDEIKQTIFERLFPRHNTKIHKLEAKLEDLTSRASSANN